MKSGPTVTGVSVPLLTIESGPQKGCSLALQTGVFSVGKSLDNDAVIADQTLSDKHFQIQTTLFGIELKVLHGTVILPSGQTISDNQSYSSRKNIAFSAGNTDFSLILPKKRKIWLYGLSALLLLLLGAFSVWHLSIRTSYHQQLSALPPPNNHKSASDDVVSMQKALQAKLTNAHLETLTVSTTADGAISVTGLLQPEQSDAWSATKLWFDQTYGTRNILLDHTFFPKNAMRSPVQIAAVALGAQPYVLDTNGARLPPGSTVEDGWIIDQILPDKILLHRGSEHLAVRF
ncbi:SctD/MshK family protein [Acetobacter pasteurianus]|uniref:SctD/MshK family protein n=1 Tax=Acetobacter pasteurianus TaxID=438 RepID=UPI003D0AC741